MLIKEDLNQPETESQILSTKEQYLQKTNTLILKFMSQISLIQNQKKTKNELIQSIKHFCENENQDCSTPDFQIQSITERKNLIIKTSQNTIYKCSCHDEIFESPQALGGHQKKKKKQ